MQAKIQKLDDQFKEDIPKKPQDVWVHSWEFTFT